MVVNNLLDRALSKVNMQAPTSVKCTEFGKKEMDRTFLLMREFLEAALLIQSRAGVENIATVNIAAYFNLQRVLLSSGFTAGYCGKNRYEIVILLYFIVEDVFKWGDNQILEDCVKKISLVYEEYVRSLGVSRRLSLGNINNEQIERYFVKFGYEAIVKDGLVIKVSKDL